MDQINTIANDAARAIVKGIEDKTGVELDLNLCLDIVDLIGRAIASQTYPLRKALEAVRDWRFDISGDCVTEARLLAQAALGGEGQ